MLPPVLVLVIESKMFLQIAVLMNEEQLATVKTR